MRLVVALLACLPLLGQSTNPLPTATPIYATASVQAWGDVISLYNAVFPGQPAQLMSCTDFLASVPSIQMFVSNGVGTFQCSPGLAQWTALSCPGPVQLPDYPGPLYVGIVGSWLTVSDGNGPAISCTQPCAQTVFMQPSMPGEYSIAIVSNGVVTSRWTGFPGLPQIQITKCTGSVVQTSVAIQVNCQ